MQRDPNSHQPILINYFYFGSLFTLLILLSVSNLLIRDEFGHSYIFFLLYSIGEATLEVIAFIIAGWAVRRFLPTLCYSLYIGFTFICLLMHFIDFMLERIMNFSIFETIGFVFDESFENFLNMLEASGLPLWIWLGLFLFMACIPVLGIAIYRLTGWFATQKPLGIRLELLMQICFCIPVALFLWDFSASRILSHDAHRSLLKSLPWKITFLQSQPPMLSLSHLLPEPPSEEEVLARLVKVPIPVTQRKKPNIYLFVVESLREDFIEPSIAPTLSAFKAGHGSSKVSLSNANGTMISWFSLFHSNYPYYWSVLQKKWKSGSPALALLKKMGYDIQVYSSANLAYYGMQELIFGEKAELASQIQFFPHVAPKEAWESDQDTIDAFEKDRKNQKEGQCCIFFWDATHFDYSWPKNAPPLFSPVASEMNYFKAYHSKEAIESIKNRYRNAVHYMDGLFQRFLSLVKDDPDCLIVFTGDHGEEFFEHGHLFHLSQLSDVQTHVPIYFKLPKTPTPRPQLISHMDIFPTLLDTLGVDLSTVPLQGQSIFSEHRWPYAVIARYNASRTPYEFCLHNGRHKLIARFSNHSDIFHSRSLELHSICTCDDKSACTRENLASWITQEFQVGLDKLFSAP